MARARTIQIYLPSGDPRGLRVAELTTSIVRVIEVPRSLLADFRLMPESKQVGLYFLFGGDQNGADAAVYIGQSGTLGDRLAQHNSAKDFWNKALVVVSLTNNFTQTHAAYLEWSSIKAATEAGRYVLENGNAGNKPHTPPPLQADCDDVHDTARTLLATLGFPIFEPIAAKPDGAKPVELFYCTSGGVNGTGEYTSEGFVVLEGSKGRIKNVASIEGTADQRFRERLITDGVMVERDGMLVFTKDHLFGSPSMAAVSLLGRTANGWLEWKSPDGKTLNELKRNTT